MKRLALMAAGLALLSGAARAQSTNCYTTGYPPNQHLWCNTTPAPDSAAQQQFQQSEAQFGTAAGGALGRIAARIGEKQQERQDAGVSAINAANYGQCQLANTLADESRSSSVRAYVESRCTAPQGAPAPQH